MNIFQFFIICKRTNNANNANHYVKLGKKRLKSSKRNYYIISPGVIIKAIIIMNCKPAELLEIALDVFMLRTTDLSSVSSINIRVLHPESIMPSRCPSNLQSEL